MKMKMSLALVIMAALAVCAPLQASAEIGKSLYVVAKAGAGFPSDFDTDFVGELGIGWDFSPAGSTLLALELTVGYNSFSTDASLAGTPISIDNDAYPIGLTLKTGRRVNKDFTYYGGAGLDIIPVSIDASGSSPGQTVSTSTSDTVFGAHLLVGATYDLTSNIFIGAEAKYLWSNTAKISYGWERLELDASCFSVMGMIGFRF